MCFDTDSLPPVDADSSTGERRERLILTSTDGARFTAFQACPQRPTDAGVVVLPDARGLHRFYEELAARLADKGHNAVAIDYFGRTAGTEERGEDFPYMEHVARTTRATFQADVAAAVSHLRSPDGGRCRAILTLGFCLGGRLSFLAAAFEQRLAGVIGFYGFPGMGGPYRDAGPTQLAHQMTAPVLALMGGADHGIPPSEVEAFDTALTAAGVEHEVVVYPGAPHSFFDVKHEEFADASADAWQRVLEFLARHSDRAGR